jgi:hypothetical protein
MRFSTLVCLFTFPVASLATNVVPRAPDKFVHPGVLVSRPQLDLAKSKVLANQEPWASAYTLMLSHDYARLTRSIKPVADVDCGSYYAPDTGCTAQMADALSAYTTALAWYFTGNPQYAEKSIAYMMGWANVLVKQTGSNAPLLAGWTGSSWSRAAEIIRHTYTGWKAADITKFSGMLKNIFLPTLLVGAEAGGNWELCSYSTFWLSAVFLAEMTLDFQR